MKKLLKWTLPLVSLLLISATSVFADITGSIEGTVVDKESGEPMVGVSVSVQGTDLGGITNEEGRYFILLVTVGKQTLEFSSIGFATITVTDVDVTADLAYQQNAEMVTATAELQGITVTAATPLVDPSRNLSVTVIKAEQIQRLPTRGYQQVVSLQSGMVTTISRPGNRSRGGRESSTTSELNIRGGRPTSVLYLVDGFSQQDPLSGLSTTAINNNAIQEVSVMTGGFPAEYGYVSAAVVNTITKSGTENFSGVVEVLSDEILGDEGFGQNTFSLSVGGPLTILEGADFYFSGERREFADRDPSPLTEQALLTSGVNDGLSAIRLPTNDLQGWTYSGKIRYDFTPAVKLQLTGTGSQEKWRQYRHAQLFNTAHNTRFEDENLGLNARLTHSMTKNTFYNLSVGYFRTERESGDGVNFDDLASTTDDDFGLAANLFYDPGASRGGYLHRISSYIQFKGDITSRMGGGAHQVKAGFDYQKHTLRRYNHIIPFDVANFIGNPTAQFQDVNAYGFVFDSAAPSFYSPGDDGGINDAKKPTNLAFYVQDRFDWNGMILTAGLRYDLFDYNTLSFIDPNNPLGTTTPSILETDTELIDAGTQSKFSPRLGIAFPIDDKTNMHFSYGKFFKRPDLDKLYVGFDYFEFKVAAGGYFFPIGNPNLLPEKTTAYEIGFSHQLGQFTALDITAFYKDITDLIQVKDQSANPRSFQIYQNADFATVKGLEFGLRTRRTRSIQMDLKYTLQSATGTGSYPNTQRNNAWTSSNAPIQASRLDYDQRHLLTGIFDIRGTEGSGPEFLQSAGLSTVLRFNSGAAFTPAVPYNEVTLAASAATSAGSPNSASAPNFFTIDIKGDKTFKIGEDFKLNLYVWVQNLLDRENATFVYESSGSPASVNFLSTEKGRTFLSTNAGDSVVTSDGTVLGAEELYKLRENDPTNYSNPRIIQFGLRFLF